VIVVDNGSGDGSVGRIRAANPDILILETGRISALPASNNIGIHHALAHGADYVWLLNNDTKPGPGALSALVAKALTDQRIGAVGSICYYVSAPSTVEAWGGATSTCGSDMEKQQKPAMMIGFHAFSISDPQVDVAPPKPPPSRVH